MTQFRWLAALRRLAQGRPLIALVLGLVLLGLLGIWLVGSRTCEGGRQITIGETMLLAGCR
jgi:hypothetical protein